MTHMSGPWENRIDGIREGEPMEILTDGDILELNRAIKIDECGNDRVFKTTQKDLYKTLEGTNVIFYY